MRPRPKIDRAALLSGPGGRLSADFFCAANQFQSAIKRQALMTLMAVMTHEAEKKGCRRMQSARHFFLCAIGR